MTESGVMSDEELEGEYRAARAALTEPGKGSHGLLLVGSMARASAR